MRPLAPHSRQAAQPRSQPSYRGRAAVSNELSSQPRTATRHLTIFGAPQCDRELPLVQTGIGCLRIQASRDAPSPRFVRDSRGDAPWETFCTHSTRREYRALTRTSHASAQRARGGERATRAGRSMFAFISGSRGYDGVGASLIRASTRVSHVHDTSCAPADRSASDPVADIRWTSRNSLIYGDRSLHLVRARTRGAQTKRH